MDVSIRKQTRLGSFYKKVLDESAATKTFVSYYCSYMQTVGINCFFLCFK